MAIPFSFNNPMPQTNPILITANTQASPGSWDAFPTLTTVNSVPVSAYLELQGTNGALLVNRLTTTQKNAITTVVNGMMLYDSTLNKFQFREGSSWTTALSSALTFTLPSSLPTISGINIPLTVDSTGAMSDTDYGQNLHKVSANITGITLLFIGGTPVNIIPAPGANKFIKLHSAVLKIGNIGGATPGGTANNIGIQYGNTANLAGTLAGNTISANLIKVSTNDPIQSIEGIIPSVPNATIVNQGLYITADGTFTLAVGSISLIIDVWFSIVDSNTNT